MLGPLLGSKTAENVLAFILSRENGYASEIARFFSVSVYGIQRQLEKFRFELAAYIGAAFKKINVNVVLSCGSCVSIYSSERYVFMDLDFVNAGFAKRSVISGVMTTLGFHEENRYFCHPDTEFTVEFPPGPLGVGEEYVVEVDELTAETGSFKLLSPTDCVKDRLSWYFHANDLECLLQASLVASANEIDIANIEAWSEREGKHDVFLQIRDRLVCA